jgi:hypothetical protein
MVIGKRRISMKKVTVFILALALLAASVPALADTAIENDRGVVGDMIFARPLGLASIVGGAALWVVSFPFAAISGSLATTTETLITNPIKYTFERPMGDFDYVPVPIEEQTQEQMQEQKQK